MRTPQDHRAHVDQWCLAKTSNEQDFIAKTYGVRFSELLRLPYWNLIWFTVLDSMHAFFLHTLLQHIQYIWGTSPMAPTGDGSNSPTVKPPPKPSFTELCKGLKVLLKENSSDQSAETVS
ncbi:hypothetical protein M404DRAFT_139147 [Pisolithus tinctorius Marx 270]|uniref:Uncharacterized protein n=1 Tax=Pisolithus tinctorius Marx 270 TaxID=870435 RepID=A0A0C3NZJ4_PISTI|nr:hypothetical protein M404DRAFT_139147 [Pisolithus tinctorius Marx 270]